MPSCVRPDISAATTSVQPRPPPTSPAPAGRNCRFLQGPATSHRSVMEIRDAMREERPCAVCLLNYRKDGSRFWNAFRLEPIRDECGSNVRWFIGIQADVTRLVEAGSGAPLDALTAQGEEVAASVLQRLEAHQHELAEADRTTKFAALACVPSSLVGALGRIQGCYCLGDPNLPDCPIVFASDYFLRLTGYSCSEVVGRNCRFLQGPGTDPATVARVREALASVPPRAVTVTLLNYKRADAQGHQQPFWNSLHISPLRDAGTRGTAPGGDPAACLTFGRRLCPAVPCSSRVLCCPFPRADGKVQFFVGVQMAIEAEPEGEGGEHASAEAAHAASASGEVPAAPMADPILLLRQKGVVGSLRVATRALAQHGLRRSSEFQHAPSRAE